MTAWYDSRSRPKWKPTALNLRTSRKYAKCKANGGCIPSQNWVERNGGFHPTCKSCGVPMMKIASGTWWRKWVGAA